MKLLFYINVLSGGGAERVIANLANFFADDENDVGIVTSYVTEREYAVMNSVRRFNLDLDKSANAINRNIISIVRLKRIINSFNPDAVIAFMTEPNIRAILATINKKSKCIVSVRNNPPQEYTTFLSRFLAKLLFRFADGCVFQTNDAKKWFSKQIQKKSAVISNPINPVFYDCTHEEIIHRDGIVTVGRLNEQKNHSNLINAFSRIANRINDDLYIYGDGPMRKRLEEQVDEIQLSNRIHFLGNVTNIYDWIKKAKLFVLSSDYEGMPNALMEAMAIGLPCISTDCPCGGPRELFETDKYGVLVPVGDSDYLADQMFILLQDNRKRAELSEKAKEKAAQYHPSIICREWKQYILSIINEGTF